MVSNDWRTPKDSFCDETVRQCPEQSRVGKRGCRRHYPTPMRQWLKAALDLIYPRSCAGCGGDLDLDDEHLCWDCRSSIQIISHPFCSICGNPLEGRVDHRYTCFLCNEAKPHFDRARCAARFHGVVADMVHGFKYRQALWLEHDLASLLMACCETHYDLPSIDLVACVPLFPKRQRERGYNQSALLAGRLARHLRRPCRPNSIRRVRDTRTQTHLTASERASNVRAAFEVTRPGSVTGRRVLLVDDVMTTGATVNECSRALKDAGAREVLVVALARGG
jgi:ComF family protein